uniref:Uncharacterized protein n=1 Tax=Rhizophora mucronata TaxID=61149 RepID=A0A2P2NB97_RHIMU
MLRPRNLVSLNSMN